MTKLEENFAANCGSGVAGAVLDSAHVGDIRGAFGSIARHDTGPGSPLCIGCARFSPLSGPASS
jgi:hypothetical protein